MGVEKVNLVKQKRKIVMNLRHWLLANLYCTLKIRLNDELFHHFTFCGVLLILYTVYSDISVVITADKLITHTPKRPNPNKVA